MEKSEKVLWDKCFESMSEDEYCSTTLGKLNDIFKEYLIDKAATYDRLMSGGKKTLKEWANLLGRPVSMDFGGVVESYNTIPMRCDSAGYWYCDEYSENFEDEHFIIPKECFDYTGSWKDSLTLPDGWEGK